MGDPSIKGKRKARKLVLQALYQWLMSESNVSDIEAQFYAAHDMNKVDKEYFSRLLHGIPEQLAAIESAFTPFLENRTVQNLNPIELTMLRLSTFELFHCPEIPYRVILDEGVSLTKAFGSQDGHRYVNGVLNNLAKKIRKTEIQQEGKSNA